MSLSNAVSAGLLIDQLLHSARATGSPGTLLANGAAIYVTNIIAFGLWFWEFDRGGPVARAYADKRHADFQFPQMINPDMAPEAWRPLFMDYLYVSFTNAAAFSPTDAMPLSRWAKALMLLQSSIALTTVALVIARVVNILK
jgi:hypothetical protein